MDKGAREFIRQMIGRELDALQQRRLELEIILEKVLEEDEDMNIFKRALAREFDLSEPEEEVMELFTVGIKGDKVMVGVDEYVAEYVNVEKVFGEDGHEAIGELAVRVVEELYKEIQRRGDN